MRTCDYRSQYRGRSISFYPEIPFKIQSMAETARLQVSTYDRSGRTIGAHVGGSGPAFGRPG